jgi:hypothetical protein
MTPSGIGPIGQFMGDEESLRSSLPARSPLPEAEKDTNMGLFLKELNDQEWENFGQFFMWEQFRIDHKLDTLTGGGNTALAQTWIRAYLTEEVIRDKTGEWTEAVKVNRGKDKHREESAQIRMEAYKEKCMKTGMEQLYRQASMKSVRTMMAREEAGLRPEDRETQTVIQGKKNVEYYIKKSGKKAHRCLCRAAELEVQLRLWRGQKVSGLTGTEAGRATWDSDTDNAKYAAAKDDSDSDWEKPDPVGIGKDFLKEEARKTTLRRKKTET